MFTLIQKLRTRRGIGVELGRGHVKFVELSGSKLRPVVVAQGAALMGDQCHHFMDELAVTEVSSVLAKLFRKHGVTAKEIMFAVPSTQVSMHSLSLPKGMTEIEVEEELEFRARQCFPEAVSAVNFDYQLALGSDEDVHIKLYVCQSQMVDDCLRIASQLGLRLGFIGHQSLVLEKLIRFKLGSVISSGEAILWIDLGWEITRVMILSDNEILLDHNLEIGCLSLGKGLVDEIERALLKVQSQIAIANRYVKMSRIVFSGLVQGLEDQLLKINVGSQWQGAVVQFMRIDEALQTGHCNNARISMSLAYALSWRALPDE